MTRTRLTAVAALFLAACSSIPDAALTSEPAPAPSPYPDFSSPHDNSWGPCNRKEYFEWDGGRYRVPTFCAPMAVDPLWDPVPDFVQRRVLPGYVVLPPMDEVPAEGN